MAASACSCAGRWQKKILPHGNVTQVQMSEQRCIEVQPRYVALSLQQRALMSTAQPIGFGEGGVYTAGGMSTDQHPAAVRLKESCYIALMVAMFGARAVLNVERTEIEQK
jgi:hypothetical protein